MPKTRRPQQRLPIRYYPRVVDPKDIGVLFWKEGTRGQGLHHLTRSDRRELDEGGQGTVEGGLESLQVRDDGGQRAHDSDTAWCS